MGLFFRVRLSALCIRWLRLVTSMAVKCFVSRLDEFAPRMGSSIEKPVDIPTFNGFVFALSIYLTNLQKPTAPSEGRRNITTLAHFLKDYFRRSAHFTSSRT